MNGEDAEFWPQCDERFAVSMSALTQIVNKRMASLLGPIGILVAAESKSCVTAIEKVLGRFLSDQCIVCHDRCTFVGLGEP